MCCVNADPPVSKLPLARPAPAASSRNNLFSSCVGGKPLERHSCLHRWIMSVSAPPSSGRVGGRTKQYTGCSVTSSAACASKANELSALKQKQLIKDLIDLSQRIPLSLDSSFHH